MKTYYQDGTSKEVEYFLGEQQYFYIQELEQDAPDRYVYPDDPIKYELDSQLVVLYDKLRDVFFTDTKQYYIELDTMPIFVQSAGQDSDCALSAESFQRLLQRKEIQKIPNIYRHLYLVDCQYLIGTIQNLLFGMEDSFINYFIRISQVQPITIPNNPNSTFCQMSPEIIGISALLENYFIKAYSILDMFCKIAYEMQSPIDSFEAYRRTKSATFLWGKRVHLKINNMPNTVFEKCDLVDEIESIRNEVVHNGTWELNPKLFFRFEAGVLAERFMLFPDTRQGRLVSVKNRKHFFGDGTKVNTILPEIHREYRKRILNTVVALNAMVV